MNLPAVGTILPLRTARLILRSFVRSDSAAVHAYMSDPEVTRWLPEGIFDAAAARAFVEEHAGPNARMLAVVAQSDGNLVGHLLLAPWGEAKNRTIEIGWVFGRAAQGQGFATEAATALLSLGFRRLRAHRIIATCQPENTASSRVAQKLRMRREGRFLRCIFRGGDVWWDEDFYAVLADEYADA